MGKGCRKPLRSIKPYFMVLPVLTLYVIFVGGGLVSSFIESLGYIPALGFHTLSMESYLDIIADSHFTANLFYSIYIAAASASIATILGTGISYVLISSGNKVLTALTSRLLEIGLILPYLYVIFISTMLLSRTGIISRFLYLLNIIDAYERFPVLVFDSNGFGIVFSYVVKGIPFISLFVVNSMSKVSRRYGEVAKTLFASEFRILKDIYLPLCAKSIVWSSSIFLVYTLGSFEVPYLLGVLSPKTLSSEAFSLYINPDITQIPESMAINMIIMTLSLLMVLGHACVLNALIGGKKARLYMWGDKQ